MTLQRGAQVHGLPDWQPQPHVEAAAVGVRQPQVQEAPGQGLQVQEDFSVFIWVVPQRRVPELAHGAEFGEPPSPGLEFLG